MRTGRDEALLARLHGKPAPADPHDHLFVVPPDAPFGGAGLAYVALLLGMIALGVVGMGWAAFVALRADPVVDRLVAEGVVGPDEVIYVLSDESTAGDGSVGCLVTPDAVVRWSPAEARRVGLEGSTVTADRRPTPTVVVSGPEGDIRCTFADGAGFELFLALARRGAHVRPAGWRPVDPRVGRVR